MRDRDRTLAPSTSSYYNTEEGYGSGKEKNWSTMVGGVGEKRTMRDGPVPAVGYAGQLTLLPLGI